MACASACPHWCSQQSRLDSTSIVSRIGQGVSAWHWRQTLFLELEASFQICLQPIRVPFDRKICRSWSKAGNHWDLFGSWRGESDSCNVPYEQHYHLHFQFQRFWWRSHHSVSFELKTYQTQYPYWRFSRCHLAQVLEWECSSDTCKCMEHHCFGIWRIWEFKISLTLCFISLISPCGLLKQRGLWSSERKSSLSLTQFLNQKDSSGWRA